MENRGIRDLWQNWSEQDQELVAPTLLPYEVANALYRYQKAGLMSSGAVQSAQTRALALPITLHGDRDLHRRALAMAVELALPATYDAHYLALAERFSAQLWTADKRLAKTVQPTLGWVNLVT